MITEYAVSCTILPTKALRQKKEAPPSFMWRDKKAWEETYISEPIEVEAIRLYAGFKNALGLGPMVGFYDYLYGFHIQVPVSSIVVVLFKIEVHLQAKVPPMKFGEEVTWETFSEMPIEVPIIVDDPTFDLVSYVANNSGIDVSRGEWA